MGQETYGLRPRSMARGLLTVLLAVFTSPLLVTAAGPEIGLGRNGELTRRAIPAPDVQPGVSAAIPDSNFMNLFGRASGDDDDHTCTKSSPCKNKACCGSSGVCGYGPAYCGNGCTSNCDAKAECGQYSKDGKTECPLNVCCSEFGFCGTTAEFCDPGSGCQSNCGNPSSPGSGGNVRSQIIGYYESWRAYADTCGSLKPADIPVSALDMVNFAFAYIDPRSLDIIPMVDENGSSLSQSEAAKLYSEVTAAKLRNPKAGVWLAIGGWTFSDNNTEFQPVFGQIASSGTARQEFARNLVNFMSEYGFDGVDIDWEYPGAPDRGGSDDDIKNFPLLLEAIRKAFNDNRKGKWGISITAPSSYWYLRWFDLPGLAKHVNFINLMSYDLHGIWDRENEIGNQILAHTNLTEVDQALQLFWRSDISPSLINLGIAFYGRSYTLEDASCSKPGCKFKDPGAKGKCSNTAGYLSYREIMDKIKEAGDEANEMWDKEAGVKMVVYDSDNWISYDDSTTFQQKVDFANDRGLAGLMVWAVDQDDDGFNALKALTGKNVDSLVPESDTLGEFDLSRCYYTDCGGECNDHTGFKEMTRLNLDENRKGCPNSSKDKKQRALCCPPYGAPDPSTCHWTKGCSEDCKTGEATLAIDDYGGDKWCRANYHQFCCPASNIEKAVKECSWQHGKCPSDKPQYLTWSGNSKLCCPEKPKFKRSTCDWHGSAVWCTNTNCPVGQITVATSSWATPIKNTKVDSNGCYFGGKKSYCCDSPYGDEDSSGILPVSLDDLFPKADEIPASDETEFDQALDGTWSWDIDPDDTPFAWVVMVGPPDSVQSLRKRDGSFLETFDCPNPTPDDYGVQTFRAVCTAGPDDLNHDCEDLLLGRGAHGTIARLPAECGPDEWVRVVSFREISNTTVPRHLVKRMIPGPHAKVYEIKYDYHIRDVAASDEIYVRIDSSTHEGYWKGVVASDGKTKRAAVTDWREPHLEWFRQHEMRKRGFGDLGWWKDLFNGFLSDGAVSSSESGDYEFDQVLYQASISCPPTFDATMKARVAGGLKADLDWGISLIGTVKDTKFEQAYAYFSVKKVTINSQLYLEGSAQFTFESKEAHLLENFAPWGGTFNIKGFVTIGPVMDVTAQVDAIATLSGNFGVGTTLSNSELDGANRKALTWMYPPEMDVLPDKDAMVSNVYTEDTLVESSYEVSVAAKGSVALTVTPSVAFKVQVDVPGGSKILKTDTHITAAFPNRLVVGVGTDKDCSKGLQYWLDYEQRFNLITNAPSLGWDMDKKELYKSTKQLLPPECYKFTSDDDNKKRRGIDGNATWTPPDMSMGLIRARADDDDPAVNPLFPDPTGSCLVCARDTYIDDSPCGALFDQDGNEIDPTCDSDGDTGDSSKKRSTDSLPPLRPEYQAHQRWFQERSVIVKRSDKDRFVICDISGNSAAPRITVAKLSFPSSGDVIDGKTGGNYKTYAPDDKDDLLNYGFGSQSNPPKSDSKQYNAEHALEHQTLKTFLVEFTKRMQKKGLAAPNSASDSWQKSHSSVRDSWVKENQWTFCMYLKFWLDMIPLTATWYDNVEYEAPTGAFSQTIMKALPNKDKYGTEMPLLDMDTNSVKEAAWNDGVQDVRRVEECLAKTPPNYARAICSMRKAVFAIHYHQLIEDILKKQADRVINFLDTMEDAAANYKGNAIKSNAKYEKIEISRYFKRWMYEHAATASLKLGGLLNENIEDMAQRLQQPANPGGNPAGGGTTTGATQGNAQFLKQLQALMDGYAGTGPWNNPFPPAWASELQM
ncbi:glycoside hydrolase family 18 protein [Annulohypoxylon moriforme]|nr:glycoside hydrolase family 18 protein [Annulohypoxylon moriforme]